MALDTFLERLDWAIAREDTSRRAVAIECDLHPNYFTAFTQPSHKRTKSPRAETVVAIANHLRIDAKWLATGEGEPGGDESLPAEYGSLDGADRAFVHDLIRQLAARAKPTG